jgi:hypothetical protein
MVEQSGLIVRVPTGSRVARQLLEDPPPAVAESDVVIETVESSDSGKKEPPEVGPVVFVLPSPESLPGVQEELAGAVAGLEAHDDESAVIVIESAGELRDEEIRAVVDASAGVDRQVILAVLDDD